MFSESYDNSLHNYAFKDNSVPTESWWVGDRGQCLAWAKEWDELIPKLELHSVAGMYDQIE